jgi:outer membrane autotransporter protein
VPLKYRNEYMEVGGGVKAKLYDHVSLFANADYQFSVTGFRRDGVKGGAGLRYTW